MAQFFKRQIVCETIFFFLPLRRRDQRHVWETRRIVIQRPGPSEEPLRIKVEQLMCSSLENPQQTNEYTSFIFLHFCRRCCPPRESALKLVDK